MITDGAAIAEEERKPVLCSRCTKHAGKRLHWCIKLAFPPGQLPVRCQCPCEQWRKK
jgi:hypothetical protein